MKTHFIAIMLAVIAPVLVSACQQSRDSVRENNFHWDDSRSSHVRKRAEPVAPVAAPSSPRAVFSNDHELVWNEIRDYDGNGIDAPAILVKPKAAEAQPVVFNRGVTVFPVDGDLMPYVLPDHGQDIYGNDGLPTSLISAEGVRLMEARAKSYGYDSAGEMVAEIYFGHGSSALSAEDRRKIRAIAESVLHASPSTVLVVGHASKRVDGIADPIRAALVNFEMSMKRAASVTQELYRAGVTPGWVEAVARGDREPNRQAAGLAQEAADRRVEIFTNGN